jgi:hypothetical protein
MQVNSLVQELTLNTPFTQVGSHHLFLLMTINTWLAVPQSLVVWVIKTVLLVYMLIATVIARTQHVF